jgi:lipid-binding SYLF domain-containing protein
MKAFSALSLLVCCVTISVCVTANAGWDPKKSEKTQQTIAAFKKEDLALETFFKKSYGYAVFPSVIKGAIGIGGAHGKGQVFRRGKVIGRASLSQGSIGFQLGGQSYSEIVFFQNKAAFDRFKNGNLKFAAQASAIAVTSGAAANVAYENGVAVFTLGKKGLMFEASIGGQRFSFKPN